MGLTKIWVGINNTVTEIALADASLPSGLIAIWKGSTTTIPSGWVLCNGQNGTPDLRDKFVLGAGNNYTVGDTGGEKEHALTIDEMPNHTHSVTASFTASRLGYGSNDYVKYANNSTDGSWDNVSLNNISIDSTGGGKAHNNMPPYYALCYVMKT